MTPYAAYLKFYRAGFLNATEGDLPHVTGQAAVAAAIGLHDAKNNRAPLAKYDLVDKVAKMAPEEQAEG